MTGGIGQPKGKISAAGGLSCRAVFFPFPARRKGKIPPVRCTVEQFCHKIKPGREKKQIIFPEMRFSRLEMIDVSPSWR